MFTALSFVGAAPAAAAAGSDSSPPSDSEADEKPSQFPTEFEKEADKGPIFQYYARTLTKMLYPTNPPGVINPPDLTEEIDYCRGLAEDLRTSSGITFIEPIAKGKTIDDPAVHAHWPQCPKLDPDHVSYPGSTVPFYYQNGPVALYKVDYQNGMAANQDISLNYAPGSEPLLLFSSRLCTPDVVPLSPKCIGSIFQTVSPSTCELPDQVPGGGQIDVEAYKYNLNAVMRYKGLVWLIGVSDDFNYERFLEVVANGPVHPVRICTFRRKFPNEGPAP